MEQKEFIEQFEELKNQYEQNQRSIVIKMRDLVKKYNGSNEVFVCKLLNKQVNNISESSYEELKMIYDEVKLDYQGDINADKNRIYRENNMKENKYTKDNPYPGANLK